MVAPIFEASIFQALIGLRSTNATIDQAAERVATGLRVNSADDDVQTFIRGISIGNTTSQLTSRVNAADSALVPIDAAIQTLENALNTLSTIRTNLTDTLASGDYTTGSSIHLQLETSFVGIVAGSNIDGRDLLAAGTDVTLFVDGGGGDITVTGSNFTAIAANAGGGFAAVATAADVNTEITKVDTDVSQIQTFLGALSAARAAITALQDADSASSLKAEELQNQLLAADLEKESATLTAAQTQRDVALTAIGIISASQRNILAIFG